MIKRLEKDIKKDLDKMKSHIDKTETEVKRLSESKLPSIHERFGDEIDSLTERVISLEKNRAATCTQEGNQLDKDRKRRIVIRNLQERQNENIKDRVNNIIDYLKISDVSVEKAERKINNYSSKPGVVIATFSCSEDKHKVMDVKKNLKKGTRYHDVYIENDVPAHQRKLKNNIRTIVNTLGGEKLKLHGSRVIKADFNSDVAPDNQDQRNAGRGEHKTSNSTRDSYDSRRSDYSQQYHNRYEDRRDEDNYYSYSRRGRRENRNKNYHNQRNGYRQ